ncbi:MAG: nitroreductase family deazaflavin-dependent oxidoreductase [Humibacillus sp.]|nr:nitroreductase family deazaflavin-dependent oxidoreductase [Humibacillus sp.]MDN5776255.1 nitroreductase family deazaflavin-dependent oxidoreductase [Humibacillus sp.]
MLLSSLAARALRTRTLVRAPIPLYRNGFGWLFGSRMLMLEHTGRSSGQIRYVCLEVVERPAPDQIIIVSGFGEEAQWYRNLQADPHCFVSIGRRRHLTAHATLLDDNESALALGRYQRAHPRAWARLHGTIERAVNHPVTGLPMVRLTMHPPNHS